MSETDNALSLWTLVSDASLLVKIVMLILFCASMVSWVMIFQRAFYQSKAKTAFDYFEKQFWSGIDLNQLYRQGNGRNESVEGIENIFRTLFKTADKSNRSGDHSRGF